MLLRSNFCNFHLFQSCAVAFIEKLDGPALNLTPEEFEGYMQRRYTPGVGSRRQKVASDTQQLLEELKGRQEKLDQGVDALNVELHRWVQAVHSQFNEATQKFALVQQEIASQAEHLQDVSSTSAKGAEQENSRDHSVLTAEGVKEGMKE